MAVDSEQKRWAMLGFASGVGRNIVFNPATSGLSSIEKITVLKYYGGISWSAAVAIPSGGDFYIVIRRRRRIHGTLRLRRKH